MKIMKETYSKRYSIDVSRSREDVTYILWYERDEAIFHAMNNGTRVGSFTNDFEEYLFKDGLLRVDNKLGDGNDMEFYSRTEEGLKRLVEELGLS